MKRTIIQRAGLVLGAVIGSLGLAIVPASAAKTAGAASGTSTADQARLQLIINRGNNEISRRLTTLTTLTAKINASAKLTDSDKATLSGEVSDETGSLTALKAKLDADTTVADAKADAQSIIDDYRVYALIVPKINLVKTADDQQVAEGKLSDLAAKLQTRVTAAKAAGKNVTSLQNGLTTMNGKISAAQAISSNIESGVVNLQPSDYNTNHSVLSGDRNQLKTAQSDIQDAVKAASTIVNGLKTL
ncbi:MAG TPA: hypothetical protein VII55_01245 [Candidatus Saccharimonadales bacterium]